MWFEPTLYALHTEWGALWTNVCLSVCSLSIRLLIRLFLRSLSIFIRFRTVDLLYVILTDSVWTLNIVLITWTEYNIWITGILVKYSSESLPGMCNFQTFCPVAFFHRYFIRDSLSEADIVSGGFRESLCVCLSADKLKNYWSKIDVTWYEYVLWWTREVVKFRWHWPYLLPWELFSYLLITACNLETTY